MIDMLIISILSLCLVEGTHQEQVQLVEVDAPEITHVDDTLSMLNKSRIQFKVGSWQVADFEGLYFIGQVCHGELNGSVLVNYLNQVVCRLNRCICHTPCRRLLRNFSRGHSHAGGGGTVSNSV